VNLLEKQLSTISFKDFRFPWVTLYKHDTKYEYNVFPLTLFSALLLSRDIPAVAGFLYDKGAVLGKTMK